uniref:Uncharacterized protein n=1 Tax=Anguilla anguilla TaxID=7936 RepID=A0A0E9UEZ2_ANGAN
MAPPSPPLCMHPQFASFKIVKWAETGKKQVLLVH